MVNVSLDRFTLRKGRRYHWVDLRTSLDVWEYKKISCAGGILTPDGSAHSLAVVTTVLISPVPLLWRLPEFF